MFNTIRGPLWCAVIAMFWMAAPLSAQLTVSNVTVTNISHGSALINFQLTGGGISIGGCGASNCVRADYAVSPASCTTIGSGTITYIGADNSNPFQTTPPTYSGALSGLAASTTYNVCPEVSNDSGSTWYGTATASFTTLPATQFWQSGPGLSGTSTVHPALPIAPTTFAYAYPNTTGYHAVTVSTGCSDFMTDMFSAIQNQASYGTVISLPAGMVCSGTGNGTNGNYWLDETSNLPGDVKSFSSSAVSSNTITIASHGFTANQGVKFAGNYGDLGWGTGDVCKPGSSNPLEAAEHPCIAAGVTYYVIGSSLTTNTFQVSANPGTGIVVPLYPSGSNIYVYAWPRTSLNWIVVRTATPDSSFVPQGVRVSPQWAPLMAIFMSPLSNRAGGSATVDTFLDFSDQDANNIVPNSHIMFSGIEFTTAPNPYASTSSDPLPWYNAQWATSTANDNIICDRCYFNLPGIAHGGDRAVAVLGWNGSNVGLVNSYFSGMHYFHPAILGLGVPSVTSGQSFTINSGTYSFGAGKGSLSGNVTVTLAGTPTGGVAATGFVYFPMYDTAGNNGPTGLGNEKLNVAIPAGMTASCSGAACAAGVNIIPTQTAGGGRWLPSSSSTFPTNAAQDYYMVSPIWAATSGACSTSGATLFANFPSALVNTLNSRTGTQYELGVRSYADTTGVWCGEKVYVPGALGTSTGLASLWNDSGTLLAQCTLSTAGSPGYVSCLFGTAQTATVNTPYIASYNATNFYDSANQVKNQTIEAAPLHAYAMALGSNGNCDYSDTWPEDSSGQIAAGDVACVNIGGTGQITSIRQPTTYEITQGGGAGEIDSQWWSEGCQCMQGGDGPGPWAFVNNYAESSGNPWHFSDDGRTVYSNRGDYLIQRNHMVTPLWTLWQTAANNPASDGNRYAMREMMEWKGGFRGQIYGNIWDGHYADIAGTSNVLQFQCGHNNTATCSDMDVRWNTVKHVGGFAMTGGYVNRPNVARYRFDNNLIWDVNGGTYHTYLIQAAYDTSTIGQVFQGPWTIEDQIITHNTVVGNTGSSPEIFELTESGRTEGMVTENNIFSIDNQGGIMEGNDTYNLDSCYPYRNGAPVSFLNCFATNYKFDNNLLMGNGITQATITGMWGSGNYTQSNQALGSVGWFNCPGTLCTGTNVAPNPNFRLKAGYCSGCGNPANDGKDVGVDIDALDDAQGVVRLIGATSVGTTTATVTFDTPDFTIGCPVDVATSPWPIQGGSSLPTFTRTADAGSGRVHSVALSSLTSKQVYYYTVECPVEQKAGIFRTH